MTRLKFLAPTIACSLVACVVLLAADSADAKTRKHTKSRPTAVVASAPTTYAKHPAASAFAHELEQAEGWPAGWALQWLSQAEKQNQAIQLVKPSPVGSAKNWQAYCQRFVEPRRLAAGVRFWQTYEHALAQAETAYGVPAWLVVGILGVETLYGEHTGRFRTLDALSTLAFDFPAEHPRAEQRSAYFKSELAALLKMSHDSGTPPTAWLGSYAGAMGLPQFMPSNWSKLGVDMDGDGHIDLLNSPADAIGSVANYLHSFGWQPGMPPFYDVRVGEQADLATLLAPDIVPSFTPLQMHALGAQALGAGTEDKNLLALVKVDNGDPAQGGLPPSYVAGTQNFYVVTRYNWSSYYALAVITLGQAVAAQVADVAPAYTCPGN